MRSVFIALATVSLSACGTAGSVPAASFDTGADLGSGTALTPSETYRANIYDYVDADLLYVELYATETDFEDGEGGVDLIVDPLGVGESIGVDIDEGEYFGLFVVDASLRCDLFDVGALFGGESGNWYITELRYDCSGDD